MVMKRLQSFSRKKYRSKRKGDAASTMGESLKSEDCFVIEIPQVMSDEATRGSIFLAFTASMGGQTRGSANSSVSSVTTNSGSIRSLSSRSTNEYTRKEKKMEKDKKEPLFASNSIAATICHGGQRDAADYSEEDTSAFTSIMSCLPECCCAGGGDAISNLALFSFSDDRSDVALADQMDDDTIDPMDGYKGTHNKVKNTTQSSKPVKSKKKFLGFMRRTRTGTRIEL
jgi:hypothetical protein